MLKIDPSHWRRPKLTTIHQLVCPWAPWVEGSQFMAEWCEIPLASNPWSPGLLLLLHPCFEALHTTKWATWRGFDVFWCFELEHLQGHYGHYSHFFPKCHIPIQILPGSFWIKKACPAHWTSHLVTWSHDASWAWALPSAVLNSAASIYRCLPFKGSKLSAAKHVWKWGDTVPVRTSVSPGWIQKKYIFTRSPIHYSDRDGFRAHWNSKKYRTSSTPVAPQCKRLHEAPPETENMAKVLQVEI